MAISKRTRFEIFKQDNFKCRYCGKTPPDTTLEIDHLIPKSKGGSDDVSNLMTSCFDCNRGKSNIKIDHLKVRPDIKKLKAELAKQLKIMRVYYNIKNELQRAKQQSFDAILNYWYQNVSSYMSEKQQASIRNFLGKFTHTEIINAIDIAQSKVHGWNNVFKYMCGILHNWSKNG